MDMLQRPALWTTLIVLPTTISRIQVLPSNSPLGKVWCYNPFPFAAFLFILKSLACFWLAVSVSLVSHKSSRQSYFAVLKDPRVEFQIWRFFNTRCRFVATPNSKNSVSVVGCVSKVLALDWKLCTMTGDYEEAVDVTSKLDAWNKYG